MNKEIYILEMGVFDPRDDYGDYVRYKVGYGCTVDEINNFVKKEWDGKLIEFVKKNIQYFDFDGEDEFAVENYDYEVLNLESPISWKYDHFNMVELFIEKIILLD